MSDIEKIFWVLTALTVLFAMVWVRPGGVLFISTCGERHRLRWLSGRSFLRNGDGGLLLGNLAPLGSSFVASPWPVAVSPSGVLARSLTAPTPDGKPNDLDELVGFAELQSADNDGRTLLVNGKPFVKFQSKTAARRWARWLKALQALSEAERAQHIENAIAQSCDSAAAADALGACWKKTRWLRLASSALFVYCFLMLGLEVFAERGVMFQHAMLGYAAFLLLTFLMHRRAELAVIGPEGHRDSHGWMMLVSPVDAFRAADHLFWKQLEMYHPLALSLAVGKADDDFARRVVHDIYYPLPDAEPIAGARAEDTARWCAQRMQQAILGILSRSGVDPNSYLIPPQPYDKSAVAYCPRCDGQFVRVTGPCTACGLTLQPFVKSQENAPVSSS